MTVVLGIEQAIAALLNADGAPCAFDRAYPGEYVVEQLPAANLVPHGFKPDPSKSDGDSLALTASWAIVLHGYAGSLVSPGTAAIDPLLAWAWQQILADVTLGGTVRELSVSQGTYHYDGVGDGRQVHLQLDITVELDVVRSDLTRNYNLEG